MADPAVEISPTPYDIVELPIFPYVPGPTIWIVALTVFAALLLWRILQERKKILSPRRSGLEQVNLELDAAIRNFSKEPKALLNRVSILVRRYLETHGSSLANGFCFEVGCTESEIKELMGETRGGDKGNISNESICEILSTLIEIEGARFREDISKEMATSLAIEMRSRLANLISTGRP